jgi:hypothetical protein
MADLEDKEAAELQRAVGFKHEAYRVSFLKLKAEQAKARAMEEAPGRKLTASPTTWSSPSHPRLS